MTRSKKLQSMEILEQQKCAAMEFGSQPLLVHPDGRNLDLATGYIPLLSTFSFEDKAAKGLRKSKTSATPDILVYISALELVRDNKILLLSGPNGCGKTTFAKHLCYRIAGKGVPKSLPIVRNKHGNLLDETWDTSGLSPCYFHISDAQTLETVVNDIIPEILNSGSPGTDAGLVIVLDAMERAGIKASQLLSLLGSAIFETGNSNHRLVVLVEEQASELLNLPLNIARHSISPLLVSQRRLKISDLTHVEPHLIDFALGAAGQNPTMFALALQTRNTGCYGEKLLDAWLFKVTRDKTHLADLEEDALQRLCDEYGFRTELCTVKGSGHLVTPMLTSTTKVRRLLAARYLSRLPLQIMVELFRHDPARMTDVLRSVIVRVRSSDSFEDLATVLLQDYSAAGQRAALLMAENYSLTERLQRQVTRCVLDVIEEGILPFSLRVKAGCVLSNLGDPRDLAALAFLPAGSSSIGSETHPNSIPVHRVAVGAFNIGVYPVTVGEYAKFTVETHHAWCSPDKDNLSRQNAPATDLTWFDALAFCVWLTKKWQTSGKIKADEEVRLPTEPEWERAARGDWDPDTEETYVYPWDTTWYQDRSNSEEAGLNKPCAVGLFPKGHSPYGCQDMAGNIWEWCSTVWGESMTIPRFSYPWQQDDGREDKDAPATLRRVLRGGCFSSDQKKANCTYRGSLEPSGRWRGNGFRIVVAPVREPKSGMQERA